MPVAGTAAREGVEMRSPNTWFFILGAVCMIAPYLLGVQPKTRRQWLLVGLTIAFLAWLLPLMVSLRSR
jgi:hypothetical protein